MSQSFFPEKI